MGNVKWDVRNGAEYWKREMGSEDCECSHHTSHMASEKWEVGLKRGFPFLKYPTLYNVGIRCVFWLILGPNLMKPRLNSYSNPTYRSAIPDGAGGAAAESAPTPAEAAGSSSSSQSLAQSMLNAVCDLLFCPEFTVAPNKASAARHGHCT